MQRRASNRNSNISYQALEERKLLAADFTFNAATAELTLFDFQDSDSGLTNETVTIEQLSGGGGQVLTLSEGVWSGTNAAGFVEVDTADPSRLLLNNPTGINSIVLRSDTGDSFDVQFGDFGFDGDITIEQDGAVAFGTVFQQAGTSLVSTGALEITGADDIALDNTIGNDLGNIVIQNANSISLADASDLDAVSLEASGDVTVTSGGNLTLEEAVAVGGNLLLNVEGDLSQLSSGAITANGLALQVDGSTVLVDATNNVQQIALDNNAATRFFNAGDLKIGSVTPGGSFFPIDGITTSDDDVKLTANGNLTLEEAANVGTGDLFLDVNGDVSQLAAGTIDAAGLGLMVEGETALNAANDIDVLAANNNGATQVNDINDLKVGTVTANGLALQVDGSTVLVDATNNVQQIALDNNGATRFFNAGDLKIGSVTPGGSFFPIDGITTSDDDVKLTANGNLTLEEAVNVGESDLFLDVNGDVSQLAAGTIDAAGLGLMVEGETVLNAANDIDILAANNNGATQVNDINDLKVGTVTAKAVSADRAMTAMNGTVDAAAMSITGVTTSDDDVKLAAEGNLTLEETVDVGESDLFLDVNGDVSQLAAGTIDAAGLGLMVEGETVLNEANDIDVLAANNNGATQVNDINDLKVGAVTAESVSADRAMTAMNGTVDAAAMSITGVTTSDDDVKLTAEGNLTLEEAVNVGEGDLLLDANGDVSQLAAGTIDAAGLGLMVEGETVLNAANDIDVLAADNNGASQVNDINDLKVGTVTAEAVSADRAMAAMNGTVDAAAMSITGVTTSDDDVKLTAEGNLTLEEAANVGEGDLFLDVNGDVSQLAAGTIDAAGLGLMVEGETVLNVANDIDVLAANNNGATRVNDINELNVGTVTAEAVSADRAMAAMNGAVVAAAMSIGGVTTSNDDVKLTAAGNLTLEEAVDVGEGDLVLDVNGDVSQLAAGTIEAAGLGLMVEGETVLNAANDIDVLATDNNGATRVNSINDLTVGTVTAEAVSADQAMAAMNGTNNAASMSISGIATTGDLNITTVNGTVFQDDDAPLLVGGDASFNTTGTGHICLTNTNNVFVGDLSLSAGGDLALAVSGNLNITASFVSGGGSLRFIADQITIDTDIVGDQLLLEATNGVELLDTFFVDVTDLLLSGTGDFDLVNAGGNVIDNLAVDVDGDVAISNAVDVNFGTLTFDSNCGDVTISGVNVDAGAGGAGNFELMTIDADITQSAAVTVEGTATLDAGTGDVDFSGADRTVERAGTTGDTTDASTTGDGLNDNDFNRVILSGGTISINDVSDLFVNGITISNGDASITAAGTTNLSGPVTLGTGDLLVNSGVDIVVGSVQAQNVSLNAGDDVRDTGFRDGQFVTTENLTIVALDTNDDGASDGVRIDTATDEISVETLNGGGVFINELDDINLTSINSTGRLIVGAGGSINAEDVSVISSNDGNDVRLTSADQIVINGLLAPSSNVFLVAGDHVRSVSGALPIVADHLTVRASNTSGGIQDGIVLSTNVVSLDVALNDAGSQSSGVISIAEANTVIVKNADSRIGEIEITSNGNLIAENVFSMGSTADDAIRLTANGVGGDVVTGRVATFQRLGGIEITASDDIRPITERPGVVNLLQSGLLQFTAGNNQQDLLFNGILAPQTRVRSLTANVTSAEEAGIFVTNQGFLNVQSLTVQSGSIALTNINGNVTVENASIQNATLAGLISLRTEGEGSDLRVGNIFARGSEGVFLNSADDIFDTSFLDEIFIDADFLGATSNNNFEDDDGNNGVFVSTSADRDSALTPNGGAVFIANKS